MDQQKTGVLICRLRKERGMTQRELAEALSVTDKAVSKWERGQSYPDITILTALAEALGVTERELLVGERAEDPAEPPPPELVVRATLDYAQKAAKQHTGRLAAVLMSVYSALLLLAVFICALVDVLLNKGFTWSLIVLSSCLLAWGAAAPFYYVKKHKVFWAAAVVTALVLGLLWSIQGVDPMGADWFPSPGLFLAGLWLVWMWVPVLLLRFTRINRWYVAAVAVLLTAPANFMTNYICNDWGAVGIDAINVFSNVAAGVLCVLTGIVLFGVGRRQARK